MCRSGHDLINGLRTNLYGFSLPGPRDPFGTTHRSSASSVRDLASHGSDLRQCTSFADGERLAASAASAPVRATRLPACVSLPLHPSLPPKFFFPSPSHSFPPGICADGNLCQTRLGTRRSTSASLRRIGAREEGYCSSFHCR